MMKSTRLKKGPGSFQFVLAKYMSCVQVVKMSKSE